MEEPRLEKTTAVAGSGQQGALVSRDQEPWLEQTAEVAGSGQQGIPVPGAWLGQSTVVAGSGWQVASGMWH